MSTGTARLSYTRAVVFITVLLVISTACLGCRETLPDISPRELLDMVTTRLLEIRTYKIRSSSSMDPDPWSEMSNVFIVENKVTDKNSADSHLIVEMLELKLEVYTIGPMEYSNISGQGWFKKNMGDQGDGYLIKEIADNLSEGASDLKMLPREGDDYVMSFKVLSSDMGMDGVPLLPVVPGENVLADCVIRVDSSSMNLLEYTETRKMEGTTNHESAAMTLTMTLTFYDIDKPLDIVPPPEALNARELEPDEAYPIPGF